MAKTNKDVGVKPEAADENVAAPETSGEGEATEAHTVPNRRVKAADPTKAFVTNNKGHERMYSDFTHGQNWKTLAEQYADNIGAEVKYQ